MYKVHERDVTPEAVDEGVTIQTLIGEKQGAPNFSMRLLKLPPLGRTPLHSHEWEHEVFVVRGEGILVCEDKEYSFGAGEAIFVPPQVEHRFRNIGGGELAFICVIPNS